jgi:hypothetical protein
MGEGLLYDTDKRVSFPPYNSQQIIIIFVSSFFFFFFFFLQ